MKCDATRDEITVTGAQRPSKPKIKSVKIVY